jgi:hypothetical protein
VLKERWEALDSSLGNLSLQPRAGRGLVSCFLYKRPILRPNRQSEELSINFLLQIMDVGFEIPQEKRSVSFILVPPGGSYS